MTLDLTDDEAALLLKELNGLIDGGRYFLSERIQTLKAIRAKIRPEPERGPYRRRRRATLRRELLRRQGARGAEASLSNGPSEHSARRGPTSGLGDRPWPQKAWLCLPGFSLGR
jgi:hypothetical protein